MAKKTFLGFGNRYLWDKETERIIARFVNFKCETEDQDSIDYLTKNGYVEVDNMKHNFYAGLHPRAIEQMSFIELQTAIKELNIPTIDKKTFSKVGVTKEELVEVLKKAYIALR